MTPQTTVPPPAAASVAAPLRGILLMLLAGFLFVAMDAAGGP
jgi:hypothetical protein